MNVNAWVNLSDFSLWGFVATVVLTTTMSLAQGAGVTRISLPFLLGTAVSDHRARAMALGTLMHFSLGLLLALLHVAIYESIGWTNGWLGALVGGAHGLFVLTTVLQLLPYVHPRLASQHQGPTPARRLEPPGFLGLNYGRATPVVTLVAHVVYGTLIGACYTPVA